MTMRSNEIEPGALRAARLAANLTQQQLAERAQLALNTVARVERGDSHPTRATRHLLLLALESPRHDSAPAGNRRDVTTSTAGAGAPDGAIDRS